MLEYYKDNDECSGIRADLKTLKKVSLAIQKARILWSTVQYGHVRMNELAMVQVELAREIKERQDVLNESK